MATEKNIQLIKKLQALAEQGVGGEKETAIKKMATLMAKYGVTEADLTDEKISDHEITYSGKYERKLLYQIFYRINHERSVYRYSHGAGRNTILIFRATEAEAVQARVEFEFYKDLWAEEVEFLFQCFVQKHRIFRNDPDAPTSYASEEESSRMLHMMMGMQSKTLQKWIGTEGTA